MWPRGSTQAQLATIDDRLASIDDELKARYDELLDDRNRVAGL